MENTTVVFRYWTGSLHYDSGNEGNVIALFPYDKSTRDDSSCSSYEHFGQHGDADYQHCIENSRSAEPLEYDFLLKELEGIGYTLEVKDASEIIFMEEHEYVED